MNPDKDGRGNQHYSDGRFIGHFGTASSDVSGRCQPIKFAKPRDPFARKQYQWTPEKCVCFHWAIDHRLLLISQFHVQKSPLYAWGFDAIPKPRASKQLGETDIRHLAPDTAYRPYSTSKHVPKSLIDPTPHRTESTRTPTVRHYDGMSIARCERISRPLIFPLHFHQLNGQLILCL